MTWVHSMGNRKREEVIDDIIDAVLLENPISQRDLCKRLKIAAVTVKGWLHIIEKVQALPKLEFAVKDDDVIVHLDSSLTIEARMESAMAFLEQGKEPEVEVAED